MNDIPRQMLRRILAKYGKDICSNARRCEGLLNDLCGSYRREINVLVNAIEERIPLDLLAGAGATPTELLLTRLEKRLEENTALTAEAATWAVESWALALGVANDTQIKERVRKRDEVSAPKTETIQPPKAEYKPTNQNNSTVNRSNPLPNTHSPVTPAKKAPPVNKHSTKNPQPFPPAYAPNSTQIPIQVPSANPQIQPSNPASALKSRFNLFRSCLLIIFLLAITSVALLFGVPYAIETMRETQRQRQSEPPRFPVR